MAVNNATGCNRILVQQGRRYDFRYRYESWVQFVSRPPPPRADTSAIPPEDFAQRLEGYLKTAPAAWDPYDR